jgi:hypothetical protein
MNEWSDDESSQEEAEIDQKRVFIMFMPLMSKALGRLTMFIILRQLAIKYLK